MAKRILYIEDEKFLGKTIQGMFEKQGAQVTLAGDGEEGLRVALAGDFTVILLDLLLPKVDGFEVLKQLKASPATKHIPVIVLSNLSSPEDEQKTKALGAIMHLVKAVIDPRKIVAQVLALGEPVSQ